MGPELSTAEADQNFAWICKQHQYLIGSALIIRTKIIWSGPEFGLVRSGYLNAADVSNFNWLRLDIQIVEIVEKFLRFEKSASFDMD